MNIAIRASSMLKVYLIFFLILLVTIFVFNDFMNPISTLFLILFLGLFLIMNFRIPLLIKCISGAIFILKSFTLYYLYTYSDFLIFIDSHNYISILNELVASGSLSFSIFSSVAGTLHVGFYYFYIFIYQFFDNALSILLINSLLTTMSSVLFFLIIEKRFTFKIALYTFILFSLSANMLLFGSFILKDPLVIFLTALALYLYLNKGKMFLAIIVSILLITVRIYSGVSIIFAILADYLIFSKVARRKKMMSVFGFIILFFILINIPTVQSFLGVSTSFILSTSVIDVIIAIPSALIRFFTAPLPWNLFEPGNIYFILFLDSVMLLLLSIGLLPFLIKWLKFKYLRQKFYIFLIPILVHALALGIEYGGDSTRQRSGIFIFLLLTLMIGFLYKKRAD